MLISICLPYDGIAEQIDPGLVVASREPLTTEVDRPLPGSRRHLSLLRLQPRVAFQHHLVGHVLIFSARCHHHHHHHHYHLVRRVLIFSADIIIIIITIIITW